MKKRLLCVLGLHSMRDAIEITNNDGHFLIRKCMKCNKVKVYGIHLLSGYYLLKGKGIPKSIEKRLK